MGATSTPITIKTNIKEKELSLEDIFDFMKNNFSKVNSNFNTKFDELKIDINEVKIKCEGNFNELKYELSKINEICSETKRKTDELGESVCVVDGKTITVNDKLESLVSKESNDVKNGVSKSDTANNSSDIENRNVVGVRVFSCLLYTSRCV